MRSSDLAPLLAARPAPAVGMRQGTVVAWNAGTLANTIDVGGATLENVPVLDQPTNASIVPGDAVTILTLGPSWLIIGRVIVPT
jgi:hypothetical protein